ncbi:hypothetical protein CYLTODRAFT_352909 [Cylindrobasidium torrendii FP15055 ss-10]|uniref:SGT1-domain-containing protein n=1 Tax=Cylindrobasidium torrendii FP15055 ss-10 TaxID=1314674 RepID=A0A0D7BBH1_9AGAR|nr:hypothetical protein CYLTODRAFT_352909 [Cylindrobasidium torrendii FP15055 ss-10]
MTSIDIFNPPPNISEDTLQYALYPTKELQDKASVTTLVASILDYVDSLLIPEFLWHRDPFELRVAASDAVENGWMLEGIMRVGDCVDDEWCTVWLLKQISAKWDLAIRVSDSDGEFLLIEAADVLPAWVTPSNSQNRVWIYAFQMHLIPISHVSPPSRKRPVRHKANDSDDEDGIHGDDSDKEYIAVEDALELVRDATVNTHASSEVSSTALQRTQRYPEALRRHTHSTNAYVPQDIAKALSASPALAQKAVEAFYTRDAAQLRVAHKMARFPPSTTVLSTVCLTRTAYAQLRGQKFFPPKVFGRFTEGEDTREWRWRDTGLKLAVGFEILYQESKPRAAVQDMADLQTASAIARKEALGRDSDYQKYIQNLKTSGYFKGELEGSQAWCLLEDKAVSVFIDSRREECRTRESFSTATNVAISQAPESVLYVRGDEDEDAWLNLDAENFDEMLAKTVGRAPGDAVMDVDDEDDEMDPTKAEDRKANEQATRLKDLASKVEQFVEGEGDLDGARFEDEEFSEEEFPDSDDEAKELTEEQRSKDMANLVPQLDPSEYGQMPATYHQSQRVGKSKESQGDNQDNDNDNDKPDPKPMRRPIIMRDRYDGVDSDDETDEEDVEPDSEDEEDQPQVVGDIDIDMGEEQDEFLAFARDALGISEEQWTGIINDRKETGAFVPKNVKVSSAPAKSDDAEPVHRAPEAGPRPNVNPNLDSFEMVMKAMDEELSKLRPGATASSKEKGKAKVDPLGSMDEDKDKIPDDQFEDVDAEMEAELREALEGDEEGEQPLDYNLIKNFLESFKSQAGLSGPVGNLAGRLQPGWQLPRDDA